MRPSVSNRADSAWLLTTGLRRQTVQGVVALAHGADLAAEGKSGRGGEGAAVGVDVGNADLNRSVVLRCDETVLELARLGERSVRNQGSRMYSLVAAHLRGT